VLDASRRARLHVQEVGVTTWLLIAAIAFALVNGLNDGGALLAVGLDVRTLRPLSSLLLLAAAVAVAPVLLGTAVATTLTTRLVTLDGADGRLALVVAVTVAVVVTWGLAARGLPTSLTLAVVGAIAGGGAGAALPVAWSTVALVLVLAAVAPLAGLGVAWALTRIASAWPSARSLDQRTSRWHVLAFGLQCLAYGANDGQKMLAVLAVAVGTAGAGAVPVVGWQLATVAVAFLVGAAIGLPRAARTLGGGGVVAARPHEAVASELASATVVLATGAIGAPVSMTQAVSGGLIGAGGTRGWSRVRWTAVAHLGAAWVLTLPLAFAAAAATTALLVRAT
jgi:inorganic phosphate transporter, PiT family